MWKKLLLFPNIQITSGPQVLELEPLVTFFDVSLEPSYYLKKETLDETFTQRCNVESKFIELVLSIGQTRKIRIKG